MADKDNTEQFVEWILGLVEADPDAIRNFLQ